MNSTNSSNPLNKVLPLGRAEVLQLNYLAATPQNRSTAEFLSPMLSALCPMRFSRMRQEVKGWRLEVGGQR